MTDNHDIVVLIHGLYMHGLLMQPLSRRIRQAGYRTCIFSYPSLRRSPSDNATVLARKIQSLRGPRIHLLAHSLGGIVVRYYLDRFPAAPGRVVTLGTPHQGCTTVCRLLERKLGFALGKSVEQGFLTPPPPWPAGRELGSLAGTLNIGLGRLMTGLADPADGTVAVAETRLTGMTDHLCLPVNHSGMLFSAEVAAQALAFFATGQFRHG